MDGVVRRKLHTQAKATLSLIYSEEEATAKTSVDF